MRELRRVGIVGLRRLATEMGFRSHSYLTRLESGREKWTPARVEQYVDALNALLEDNEA